MLFSFFANKEKIAKRMDMPMSAIVEEIKGQPLPKHQLFLSFEVVCEDSESGDEVELPYVKYRFR